MEIALIVGGACFTGLMSISDLTPSASPSAVLSGVLAQVRDTAQVMQLIVLGRLVAVLPESVRDNLRSELVAVPVLDGQLTAVVVAWPERSRSRAVAAFVRAATGLVQTEEGSTVALPAGL